MADIFLQADAQKLLVNKRIVFLGDSNTRALYKDLIQLLQKNIIISAFALKQKGENSFEDDKLVYASHKHCGRDYREERSFQEGGHNISFHFITHCYDDYMENILHEFKRVPKPDLIIMNSCLWDVTRWGPNGAEDYKINLGKLMEMLKKVLKDDCLFIWTTTLPVSQEIRGGFLIKQIEFMKYQLRFEIMEANLCAWKIVTEAGYDVLDFHYYMQWEIEHRAADGIHWECKAVRLMTNFWLTHVALAWNCPLPGRWDNLCLNALKEITTTLPPLKSGTALDSSTTEIAETATNDTVMQRRNEAAEDIKSISTTPHATPKVVVKPRKKTNRRPQRARKRGNSRGIDDIWQHDKFVNNYWQPEPLQQMDHGVGGFWANGKFVNYRRQRPASAQTDRYGGSVDNAWAYNFGNNYMHQSSPLQRHHDRWTHDRFYELQQHESASRYNQHYSSRNDSANWASTSSPQETYYRPTIRAKRRRR